MTANEIISLLGLEPHPEGGFFRETCRSGHVIACDRGERSAATSIYYLITQESFSTLHRLASDELFHFYLGDTVEMLQLFPGGDRRGAKRRVQRIRGLFPESPPNEFGVWNRKPVQTG